MLPGLQHATQPAFLAQFPALKWGVLNHMAYKDTPRATSAAPARAGQTDALLALANLQPAAQPASLAKPPGTQVLFDKLTLSYRYSASP